MNIELSDIDKPTILKYIAEADIFKLYLGFDTIKIGVQYINPLPGRNDKSPGCTFFIREHDGRLIFHDWGREWKGDCFDMVMAKYNCSFAKAVNKIAVDFKLVEGNANVTIATQVAFTKKKEPLTLQIKRRNFNSEELAFWNVGGLKVDQTLLNDNNIFVTSTLWERRGNTLVNYSDMLKMNFAYKFPGKRMFQIYRPMMPRTKRRFINAGGILYGDTEYLNPLCDYVVITKSKKDAFFLRLLGINTFFIIHEGIRLSPEFMYLLKKRYKMVFTLFDHDIAGIRRSAYYKVYFGTIPLLYDKEDDAKDTYAMLKKYDMYYMIDLIENIKAQYELT